MAANSLENMTEQELAQRVAESAQYRALLSDSNFRGQVHAELKRLNPKLPIPEYDAKQELLAANKALTDQLETLAGKFKTMETSAAIAAARDQIKAAHKLTDAEVVEVEKLMVDPAIAAGTHAAAAEIYRARKNAALAVPTPASLDFGVHMPAEEGLDWLKGDPAKIARQVASNAINEIIQARR